MTKQNRCKAKLRLYPDPILKAVCEPIGDDEDVSGIIRDMMHILTNSKTGVGLAAPQAGHTRRIIIAKIGNFAYTIIINPTITSFSRQGCTEKEGCLSYPNIFKDIYRSDWVRIKYTTDGGKKALEKYYYHDARIIQHEIDHLDGKCKVGE